MEKKKEDIKEEEVKEVKEEVKLPISLAQVPSDFETVVVTPDGAMRIPDYLVWLGNIVWEIKNKTLG
jgi:hypothetical protein